MSNKTTQPQKPPGLVTSTEPGPPPSHDGEGEHVQMATSTELATALLGDLAKGSQPVEGVKETSGQIAAAYAVAPHRPPAAHEDPTLVPAVMLNLTAPFPAPLPSPAPAPVQGSVPPQSSLSPHAPQPSLAPAGDGRGDVTMPRMRAPSPLPPAPGAGGRRAQYSTVPSVRNHRKQTLLAVATVIGIATAVAVAILAFGRRPDTGGSASATSLSAVEMAPVETASAATVPGVASGATTPTQAPVPSASAPSVVVAHTAPAVTTAAPLSAASTTAANAAATGAGASRPAARPPAAANPPASARPGTTARPAPRPASSIEEIDKSF